MSDALWGWQDADARRLVREGKSALARCWHGFARIVEDPDRLRTAAELARRLHEPWWELFFWHWFVQQGLNRHGVGLQQLEQATARLAELVEEPACHSCPQWFCAHESMLNLAELVDPPGSAARTLAVAERMVDLVPAGVECRGCFEVLRLGALVQLQRLDEADTAARDLAARWAVPNLCFLAHAQTAAVAGRRGRPQAMARAVTAARTVLEGGDINEDNRWFLCELEVRYALLTGGPAVAEAAFEQSPTAPPPDSAEGIRIRIAVAAAHAAGSDWSKSRHHAEAAIRPALARGMVRLAAEASLLAAEACLALADDAGRASHVATVVACLPQLSSRDLDRRAAAVGWCPRP